MPPLPDAKGPQGPQPSGTTPKGGYAERPKSPTPQSKPKPQPVGEAPQAAQPSTPAAGGSSSDKAEKPCPKCGKAIPLLNFTMHEMRCGSSKAPAPAPKPSKKKKPKSERASANPSKPLLEEDDDLDAILNEVEKADNTCFVKGCKQHLSTIAMTCKFCNQRFCLKHAQAEIHGCGDSASKHAHAQWARNLTSGQRGQGLVNKSVGDKDWKRNMIANKLQEKLKDAKDARSTKKKDDRS